MKNVKLGDIFYDPRGDDWIVAHTVKNNLFYGRWCETKEDAIAFFNKIKHLNIFQAEKYDNSFTYWENDYKICGNCNIITDWQKEFEVQL